MPPPKTSRSSIGARRNPETEQAILDAAEAILQEGGDRALTMDAVARRAASSKATLYKWWPTRARLLLAVYARRKAQLDLADTGSLKGDLTAFYVNLFAFWRGSISGDLFRFVMAEAQFDPDILPVLRSYLDDRRRDTEVIFNRAQARGELRPSLIPATAAEIVVAVARDHLLTGRTRFEGEIDAIIAELTDGFSAPRSSLA
jgi:AcrR family transcriptional regulator